MNIKSILILALVAGGIVYALREPRPADNSVQTQPEPAFSAIEIPLGINTFVGNPHAHAGPVVLEGRVSQSFPERGAFVLVDASEAPSCCETGCAENSVPVRVDLATFSGVLPQVGETVQVSGEVFPEEVGYRLSVQGIRRSGATHPSP